MKKFAILAAGCAAIAASPAMAADNASEDIVINATVLPECSMGDFGTINIDEVPINTAAGSDALVINGTTDDRTQFRPWVSCNAQNQITLTSTNGGLVSPSNAGTAANDAAFTNVIEYELGLLGAKGDIPLNTSVTNVQVGNVVPAQHNQVRGRVIIDPVFQEAGTRPLAGTDYEDTVEVAITVV